MPILRHEERPWGYFDWIFDGRQHVPHHGRIAHSAILLKILFVKPGARLSDQRHRHRREIWYIQTGTPVVYLEHPDGGSEVLNLKEGDIIDFPPLTWHRLSAENSVEPVRVTEIWSGDILEEEDIERRSDDYGRAQIG